MPKLPIPSRLTMWKPRYFDIGVNFSDSMFQGFYHHSSGRKHPADLQQVIERAHLFNVHKMLITASTIKESRDHFDLCEQYPNNFTSTAGVHPCSVAKEFYVKDKETNEYTTELRSDVDKKLLELKEIAEEGYEKGYVRAFGEFGLDYDRLFFSTKEQQIAMFKRQLEVATTLKYKLPLFLHMRAACDDFVSIIKPFVESGKLGAGVVHSFTGTEEELQAILDLGFYISVNGCSLKTEDNLKIAALIPPERLMIETDAPWCEIRRSHASHKFLTAYPNHYYPEIALDADVTVPTKGGKIKLDEYLPFPSIKKENFQKHADAVQTVLENQGGAENSNQKTGVFAYPLIKSRNEPVTVGFVAEVMANLYGYKDEKEIEQFIDLVYETSVKVFDV